MTDKSISESSGEITSFDIQQTDGLLTVAQSHKQRGVALFLLGWNCGLGFVFYKEIWPVFSQWDAYEWPWVRVFVGFLMICVFVAVIGFIIFKMFGFESLSIDRNEIRFYKTIGFYTWRKTMPRDQLAHIKYEPDEVIFHASDTNEPVTLAENIGLISLDGKIKIVFGDPEHAEYELDLLIDCIVDFLKDSGQIDMPQVTRAELTMAQYLIRPLDDSDLPC